MGLRPLTQFDLVASPMFDAFQNTPNLAPFDHVAPTVPLDQGVHLTADASRALQQAWFDATAKMMKGKYDKADAVDPNFLNHSTWYVATGWKRPYPGEQRVALPDQFIKAAKGVRG